MKLTARVEPCGACWIYARQARQPQPAAPPADASAPAAPPPAPTYQLEPCPNRGLHGAWSARFTIFRDRRGAALCEQCGGRSL